MLNINTSTPTALSPLANFQVIPKAGLGRRRASPFNNSAINTASPLTPVVSSPCIPTFTVSAAAATVVVPNKSPVCLKNTISVLDPGEADNVGTTVNTANLIITSGSAITIQLAPGSAVFLPKPSDETWTFSDDGTPCAVEVANFT